jgi:hypothetical protein
VEALQTAIFRSWLEIFRWCRAFYSQLRTLGRAICELRVSITRLRLVFLEWLELVAARMYMPAIELSLSEIKPNKSLF